MEISRVNHLTIHRMEVLSRKVLSANTFGLRSHFEFVVPNRSEMEVTSEDH